MIESELRDDETLSHEVELPHPPEKVWRALTVPDILAAWLSPNDLVAEPGARFRFAAMPELGGTVDCEVIEAEVGKRLAYRWRAADDRRGSIVTFELDAATGGGTRLRIVHRAADRSPATRTAVMMAANCNSRRALHLAA